MIKKEGLDKLAKVFCGDVVGYFKYKSGPDLVSIFNKILGEKDVYERHFPTRYVYVSDKLEDLLYRGEFDFFLNTVLGIEYLMKEWELGKVEAAKHAQEIYDKFNEILQIDSYSIIKDHNKYHLVDENDDLEYVGKGGFAKVFRSKSTGIVRKILNDEFLSDDGIRSRFKREFEITKSLQDVRGVIKVYFFDEVNCFYTMEAADKILLESIKKDDLDEKSKRDYIRQILFVMSEVHSRKIIHRDISPSNIFIIRGEVKIADFGIGKDFTADASHRTMFTDAFGQYDYCAPEQRACLKDADKRSDVYSLGKVINFIMTKNPNKTNHFLRNVAEKATSMKANDRYENAERLLISFDERCAFYQSEESKEYINSKIAIGKFDSDIENYIYEMSEKEIARRLLNEEPGFFEILIEFMKCDDYHAKYVVESVLKKFVEICGDSFSANDVFASFAYKILSEEFCFGVKESAAKILQYIAKYVNRFHAQRLVEKLKEKGIDPTLEEILDDVTRPL